MITKDKFRNEGFIYDSLENYQDIFDLQKFKEIKSEIDKINFYRNSRFVYEYKFKNPRSRQINELLEYEKVRENKGKNTPDSRLSDNLTEELYKLSHSHQINKMKDRGVIPTFVYGESYDDKFKRHNLFLNQQQTKFVEYYYPEYSGNSFDSNTNLQFYDKGCLITRHRDGKPPGRICVFLYFLNTDWYFQNGGGLVLYEGGIPIKKIHPIFPNFLVIDTNVDIEHELLKIQSDIKYTIVSFFHGKKNRF